MRCSSKGFARSFVESGRFSIGPGWFELTVAMFAEIFERLQLEGLDIESVFVFEIHSSAHRLSWPMALICGGLVLLSWFVYEEVVWQSYAYTRWGRIDFQLDVLKSVVLSAVAYLIGAGYFLKASRQVGCKNRASMRLLRFVLTAASAVFALATIVATTGVAMELISSKWDTGLVGLLVGLLAWGQLLREDHGLGGCGDKAGAGSPQ